jgi:hypothetical protein
MPDEPNDSGQTGSSARVGRRQIGKPFGKDALFAMVIAAPPAGQPCPDHLLPEHNAPGGVSPMNLKHLLRDVQADCANLRHGRLLKWCYQHLHFGTPMPSGASTPSEPVSAWSGRPARRLSEMFEQVTPFRGYIREQTACGRLGITLSVFTRAALNDCPGSTVCHQAVMLLFGLDSDHCRVAPPQDQAAGTAHRLARSYLNWESSLL